MPAERFRRRPERPWIFGHRGVRGPKPENTLAAFEEARRESADGIELDVRLCGSGDVIVAHDRTLERVTSGRDSRDVESVALAELGRVDLGQGQGVPRLDDALDFCAAHGMLLNVELKHDVSSKLALLRGVRRSLAARRDAGDFVLLSSFDPLLVRLASTLIPGVATAWLVHGRQRLTGRGRGLRWLGARALHPERVLVTEDRVRRWQRRGALINVWTVNDPDEARRLAAWGVDAIISDHPALIRQALDARAANPSSSSSAG